MKTFLFLILISSQLFANDTIICKQQLDYILGAENKFIQEMGYKKCFNKAFQSDEAKLCECTRNNQTIIGPLEIDSKRVRSLVKNGNKEKVSRQLSKIALKVIQDFTRLDGIIELPDSTLQSCSLNKISQISCKNKNNVLSELGGGQFLEQIKADGQCELEMILGNKTCSNNAKRINNTSPKACVNEYILNQLAFNPYDFAKNIYVNDPNLKNHPLYSLLSNDEEFKKLLLQKFPDAEYSYDMNLNILKTLNSKEILEYVSNHLETTCSNSFEKMKELLCQPSEKASVFSKNDLDKVRPRKKDAIGPDGKLDEEKLMELKLNYQHYSYQYCSQNNPVKTIEDNLNRINQEVKLPESLDQLIGNINTDNKFEAKDFCSNLEKGTLNDLLKENDCKNKSTDTCQKLLTYQKLLKRQIKGEDNSINEPIISMSKSLQIIYGKPLDKVTLTPVANTFKEIKNSKVSPVSVIISEKNSPRKLKPASELIDNSNSSKTIITKVEREEKDEYEIEYNTGRYSSNFNPTIKSKSKGVLPSRIRRNITSDNYQNKEFTNQVTSKLEELNNEIQNTLEHLPNKENGNQKALRNIPTRDIANTNIQNTSGNNLSTGSFVAQEAVEPQIIVPTRTIASTNKFAAPKAIATNSDDVPLAFMMVKREKGTDASGNDALEEIELVFQNGQKPELIRLNEKDLKKFIEFIKQHKPFILTKSFNLNGYEEKITAKVFPMKNGKFYIQPVGKSNPKLISQLKKELSQAVKGKVTL